MPKILRARPAHDEQEERWVRKMAASRHGPADWIVHAKIVTRSWDGEQVETIAQELDCSPQTVRRRLHRFDIKGIEGLGDRPRTGRPRRLTMADDSRIIALARSTPPGKLKRLSSGELDVRDEQAAAHWSLNALTDAAQKGGIQIKRSQVRRICLREGVRWRRTHSWAESDDKDVVPKGERSSATPRTHRQARRPFVPMSWGQFCHATFLPHQDGRRMATGSKRR